MSSTPDTAKDIFLAALELPNDQRPELLDRMCGNDDRLRKQVDALGQRACPVHGDGG